MCLSLECIASVLPLARKLQMSRDGVHGGNTAPEFERTSNSANILNDLITQLPLRAHARCQVAMSLLVSSAQGFDGLLGACDIKQAGGENKRCYWCSCVGGIDFVIWIIAACFQAAARNLRELVSRQDLSRVRLSTSAQVARDNQHNCDWVCWIDAFRLSFCSFCPGRSFGC